MDKNLYAVILAGGSGTRFWPLSRKMEPKQFLSVAGKRSLLQETVWRIKGKVGPRNIFIITNKHYIQKVRKQLSAFKVPAANILLEPEAKNTAPAILWAALRLQKLNADSVMLVLPSDHLITRVEVFHNALDRAVDAAKKDYLVTLGIVPVRPETGYGYIKTRERIHPGVLRVERFVEKPSLANAKKFLKEKKYFWNSGMFVWRTDKILSEFKKYLPGAYQALSGKSPAETKRIWKKLPSISVDYGILEKTKDILVVAANNMGWSDLGSWEALAKVLKQDEDGNIFKGDVISLNCRNTFVLGQKRLITTVGLNGLVVIDTADAVLVCRRDLSQEVRHLVALLKSQNRKEYISH